MRGMITVLNSLRKATVGIVVSGASAVVPISVAFAAFRMPSIDAGIIAGALACAAFFGQIGNAFLIEAQLLGGKSNRSAGHLPTIVIVLLIPALAACIGGVFFLPLWAPGFVYLASVLEVSRMQSIVRQQWSAEILPALAIVAVSAAACIWPNVGMVLVAIPVVIVLVILVRSNLNSWIPFATPAGRGWWVVAEATVSSFTQPAMTFVILSGLGPFQALLYRLVGSIANLMSPVLSYVRVALLSRKSGGEFFAGLVFVGCVCVFVTIGDLSGVLARVFGERWQDVGLLVLLSALVWKASSLLTVWPYAELRRRGLALRVFFIRLTSSTLYFGFAWFGMEVAGVAGVFIGFAVAEGVSCAIYQVNVRTTAQASPYRRSVESPR